MFTIGSVFLTKIYIQGLYKVTHFIYIYLKNPAKREKQQFMHKTLLKPTQLSEIYTLHRIPGVCVLLLKHLFLFLIVLRDISVF